MQMPSDFPGAAFAGVERLLAERFESHVAGYSEHARAWSAIAIRFRAADEYGTAALAALGLRQPSVVDDALYRWERDLFGFFSNATAVIECWAFAVYHLGRLVRPHVFLRDAHEVSVKRTRTAVAAGLPRSPLDAALRSLADDQMWWRIKRIDASLTHQQSSARRAFRARPDLDPSAETPTLLADPMDAAMVADPRQWLGATLERLVNGTDAFVRNWLEQS
jgi:hypothetical protein